MPPAPRKPAKKKPAAKPKNLTVREAHRLGLTADRARAEAEAIVAEAEREAAKELGIKRAEAKQAAKDAAAEAKRIKREAAKEEKRLNEEARRAGSDVVVIPATKKGAERQRMARLHELFDDKSEEMMQVMFDIAKDKTVHASVRLDAADRFMNRLYGKPKEHLTVDDTSNGVDAQDEVTKLLGNIFEAVGLPPLLDDKGSPTS